MPASSRPDDAATPGGLPIRGQPPVAQPPVAQRPAPASSRSDPAARGRANDRPDGDRGPSAESPLRPAVRLGALLVLIGLALMIIGFAGIGSPGAATIGPPQRELGPLALGAAALVSGGVLLASSAFARSARQTGRRLR